MNLQGLVDDMRVQVRGTLVGIQDILMSAKISPPPPLPPAPKSGDHRTWNNWSMESIERLALFNIKDSVGVVIRCPSTEAKMMMPRCEFLWLLVCGIGVI